MIRPEQVQVSVAAPTDPSNVWQAKVVSATFLGNFTECLLDLQGHQIMAQIPGMVPLNAGQSVYPPLPAGQMPDRAGRPAGARAAGGSRARCGPRIGGRATRIKVRSPDNDRQER